MRSGFVPASRLYDVESRTPIAHPAHQATDADVRRALEERAIRTDGGTASSDTERTNRKVRSAISNAIYHLETIEGSLHEFDAGKNREACRKLEDALESLRDQQHDTATERDRGDR